MAGVGARVAYMIKNACHRTQQKLAVKALLKAQVKVLVGKKTLRPCGSWSINPLSLSLFLRKIIVAGREGGSDKAEGNSTGKSPPLHLKTRHGTAIVTNRSIVAGKVPKFLKPARAKSAFAAVYIRACTRATRKTRRELVKKAVRKNAEISVRKKLCNSRKESRNFKTLFRIF